MGKIKTSIVFKGYSQQQFLLLPPSLEELIGSTHLVRVVNELVERMDISELMNLHAGGGTSVYRSQNSQGPHAGHTLHVAEWHEPPPFSHYQ
jgi:hypothetical protein